MVTWGVGMDRKDALFTGDTLGVDPNRIVLYPSS